MLEYFFQAHLMLSYLIRMTPAIWITEHISWIDKLIVHFFWEKLKRNCSNDPLKLLVNKEAIKKI